MSDTQALKILIQSPVTEDMIRFVANFTEKVLPCPVEKYPTPPCSPTQAAKTELPSLRSFITRLVRESNVYTGCFLTSLVYLQKLKNRLPRDATGLPSTNHRIFLAALILSAKFHNDSSPQNKHWAKYTSGLFCIEDVNLMERQLIQMLDWELRVQDNELHHVLRIFLEPIKMDLRRSHSKLVSPRRMSSPRNDMSRTNSPKSGRCSPKSERSSPTRNNSFSSLKKNPYYRELRERSVSLSSLSSTSTLSTPMMNYDNYKLPQVDDLLVADALNAEYELCSILREYGL